MSNVEKIIKEFEKKYYRLCVKEADMVRIFVAKLKAAGCDDDAIAEISEQINERLDNEILTPFREEIDALL